MLKSTAQYATVISFTLTYIACASQYFYYSFFSIDIYDYSTPSDLIFRLVGILYSFIESTGTLFIIVTLILIGLTSKYKKQKKSYADVKKIKSRIILDLFIISILGALAFIASFFFIASPDDDSSRVLTLHTLSIQFNNIFLLMAITGTLLFERIIHRKNILQDNILSFRSIMLLFLFGNLYLHRLEFIESRTAMLGAMYEKPFLVDSEKNLIKLPDSKRVVGLTTNYIFLYDVVERSSSALSRDNIIEFTYHRKDALVIGSQVIVF